MFQKRSFLLTLSTDYSYQKLANAAVFDSCNLVDNPSRKLLFIIRPTRTREKRLQR